MYIIFSLYKEGVEKWFWKLRQFCTDKGPNGFLCMGLQAYLVTDMQPLKCNGLVFLGSPFPFLDHFVN